MHQEIKTALWENVQCVRKLLYDTFLWVDEVQANFAFFFFQDSPEAVIMSESLKIKF